jgi:TRAP-type C4-dicarboxylate transport system substrate-binding protein
MKLRPILNAFAAMLLAASLAPAAHAQERMKFKAIGQPLATGLIQKNKEQPFFENFAARTGLPIDVDYKPVDTLGIKDTEQLRIMKAGLFELVSLRIAQNTRDEPTLLGLDLVGASPDYATARKVATPITRPSTRACSSSSTSSCWGCGRSARRSCSAKSRSRSWLISRA